MSDGPWEGGKSAFVLSAELSAVLKPVCPVQHTAPAQRYQPVPTAHPHIYHHSVDKVRQKMHPRAHTLAAKFGQDVNKELT